MRDINIEIPGSNRPLVTLNVVIGEGPAIQCDLNILTLAGTEFHFCEALQFLSRTRNRRMPVANINLRNVRPGTRARIGNLEIYSHQPIAVARAIWRGRKLQIFVSKTGVGQAKSERK